MITARVALHGLGVALPLAIVAGFMLLFGDVGDLRADGRMFWNAFLAGVLAAQAAALLGWPLLALNRRSPVLMPCLIALLMGVVTYLLLFPAMYLVGSLLGGGPLLPVDNALVFAFSLYLTLVFTGWAVFPLLMLATIGVNLLRWRELRQEPADVVQAGSLTA